jgi:hypothetical protein
MRLTLRHLLPAPLPLVALAAGFVAASAQVRQSPTPVEIRFSGWCDRIARQSVASGQGGGEFRVGDGGQLSASGFRQTVVVERGGRAEVTGRNITVYVMDGGKASVAGEKNEIYIEPNALVSVIGTHGMTRVPRISLTPSKSGSECD